MNSERQRVNVWHQRHQTWREQLTVLRVINCRLQLITRRIQDDRQTLNYVVKLTDWSTTSMHMHQLSRDVDSQPVPCTSLSLSVCSSTYVSSVCCLIQRLQWSDPSSRRAPDVCHRDHGQTNESRLLEVHRQTDSTDDLTVTRGTGQTLYQRLMTCFHHETLRCADPSRHVMHHWQVDIIISAQPAALCRCITTPCLRKKQAKLFLS